jgi:hypothetical protein
LRRLSRRPSLAAILHQTAANSSSFRHCFITLLCDYRRHDTEKFRRGVAIKFARLPVAEQQKIDKGRNEFGEFIDIESLPGSGRPTDATKAAKGVHSG